MVVRVKICGLTRKRDVKSAIELGADALGFVFGYPESPRNLDLGQIKELARLIPPYVSTVIVSPSTNPELERAVTEVRPDILQVYDVTGRSSLNFFNVIETVRPTMQDNILKRAIDLSKNCRAILLDTSTTSRYSGRGVRPFDLRDRERWKLGKKLREELKPFPLILSGGLNPENISEAIHNVRPFAVDVSSGVEAKPGIKDGRKMKQFIHTARIAAKS